MSKERNSFKKSRVIVLLLIIVSAILIPISLFFVFNKEPYSIIINNDEDFDQWCDIGNGTLANPYVIEGHDIRVPKNHPIKRIIQISGTSKSFIIRNNHLSMVSGCAITIYDVEVPFFIQHNEVEGDPLRLADVIDTNAVVANNTFFSGAFYFYQVNNITIEHNQFICGYTPFENHQYFWRCSNLKIHNNEFQNTGVFFATCEHSEVNKNVFDFDSVPFHGGIISSYTSNLIVTNNSFTNSGLSMERETYESSQIEENSIMGRPIGIFINVSSVTLIPINSNNNFSQFILVNCLNVTILGYSLVNVVSPIQVFHSSNTTITNCSLSNCGYVTIDLSYSNHTIIVDNKFENIYRYGIYLMHCEDVQIKRNVFREVYQYLWYFPEETVIIEEDNILK